MSQVIELRDLHAPEAAPYASLTESQLRNRLEPEKGIFIAESPKVIAAALDAGLTPLSFLMERRQLQGPAASLLARCPETPVYTAARERLASLTGYTLTRGVLAAMRRPPQQELGPLLQGARRVAVLENIVDAANLGAIFRSAAALGMDAVLLTPSCGDPLNRRSVRVSMGTVFQLPWAQIEKSPDAWPHPGLEVLHGAGFATAAMALAEESLSLEDALLAGEEKLAVVLGTEGAGLCPETIQGCTYTVKIPMQRGVDSLNVGAAAAVAFWQLRAR